MCTPALSAEKTVLFSVGVPAAHVVVVGMEATTPPACQMYSMESGLSARLASSDLVLPAMDFTTDSQATAASWRKSLNNVVQACVVLKLVFTLSSLA